MSDLHVDTSCYIITNFQKFNTIFELLTTITYRSFQFSRAIVYLNTYIFRDAIEIMFLKHNLILENTILTASSI